MFLDINYGKIGNFKCTILCGKCHSNGFYIYSDLARRGGAFSVIYKISRNS